MKTILIALLLIGNIGWDAPESAKLLKNPLAKYKDNAKMISFGKVLYRQQCTTCHGDGGRGNGIAGRYLNEQPTDFTKLKPQTDGELFWKITNGKSPMPAFEELITKKQTWMLVNYISTFKEGS